VQPGVAILSTKRESQFMQNWDSRRRYREVPGRN